MTTQLALLRNTALIDLDARVTEAAETPDKISVPAKPSLDMLTAGSRAGGVSVKKAWEIYMAMLRCAPSTPR